MGVRCGVWRDRMALGSEFYAAWWIELVIVLLVRWENNGGEMMDCFW